jgi:hypothetical protein
MPHSSRSRRRMDRKRFGPGGRKAFRSCRNVRQVEGGGSAPALLRWQMPCPSRDVPDGRLTSHRRNPCPLCRPAPAGSRGGGGNGPVAGRLADAGRAWRSRAAPWRFPHHSTRRPSPCRRMPQAVEAARVRAANKRHATACRTWTPSGGTRARARVAPPRACAAHAHPYQTSSEASARARPSGPDLPFQTPALSRAGLPAAAIP